MNAELLNLPLQIQVSLASGYAAYVIAYVGMRERHRTIDTAFITLAFGLIATGVLFLASDQRPVVGSIAAFFASCLAGAAWRKWGRASLRGLLRTCNVSWMDDDPSALVTLSANVDYPVTQVAVLLDDGRWLRCDDVNQFHDAPYAPFLLGPNGDVALYLTHESQPSGEDRLQSTASDSYYGDRITYVPASRVRCINIRHKKST